MRHVLLPVLLGAAIACQKINYDAVGGLADEEGGGGPVAGGPRRGLSRRMGRPARCEMVTARAYGIVKDNCSFCHHNAGALGGAFTFILDLPALINRPSPTGLSKPLLVPGDPNGS